ncbi:hypothetical protein H5410_028082 [Solanum commersonii]|uniref:Uncharacterized protein n=1 Tax=Solanum commersonii TaxID=4109 RepID=A0A9J5Z6F7_SOLCO|nr:hypothetical protein H5410_028082 [Solanum commersonii]
MTLDRKEWRSRIKVEACVVVVAFLLRFLPVVPIVLCVYGFHFSHRPIEATASLRLINYYLSFGWYALCIVFLAFNLVLVYLVRVFLNVPLYLHEVVRQGDTLPSPDPT